jgi:hypothetical protein
MLNLEVKMIKEIIGANGSLWQSLKKHLDDIPGSHSSVKMQEDHSGNSTHPEESFNTTLH